MELEFDKEMDALLRKTAGGGVLVGDDAKLHLDADTIAAFAENALPQKSRTIYTQHLAACDPCRVSLANLISLNAAAESAMAAAAAPMPAVSVPWYRKLFQAPNLAYLMGGLVFVFGALFGVIILQNSYDSNGEAMSQIAHAPEPQNAPARPEAANNFSSMQVANANASTNSTAGMPQGFGVADQTLAEQDLAAPPPAGPSDASTPAADLLVAQPATSDNVGKDKAAGQALVKEAPKREADAEEKKLAAAEQEARKQDANQVNVFRNNQQNQMMPNAGNKSAGPSRIDIQRDNRSYDAARQMDDNANSKRAAEDLKASSAEGYSASRRSVGGKTFELKQAAWYDTAYSGQKTRNVRRSSGDYGKLDAELRGIADKLGGTVVIVWKGKAYRIQ